MAADNGMESIAFPALGRDDLRYPADRVVWCMMTSIIEYFRELSVESNACSVKRVTVCCDGRDEDLKTVSLSARTLNWKELQHYFISNLIISTKSEP